MAIRHGHIYISVNIFLSCIILNRYLPFTFPTNFAQMQKNEIGHLFSSLAEPFKTIKPQEDLFAREKQ